MLRRKRNSVGSFDFIRRRAGCHAAPDATFFLGVALGVGAGRAVALDAGLASAGAAGTVAVGNVSFRRCLDARAVRRCAELEIALGPERRPF